MIYSEYIKFSYFQFKLLFFGSIYQYQVHFISFSICASIFQSSGIGRVRVRFVCPDRSIVLLCFDIVDIAIHAPESRHLILLFCMFFLRLPVVISFLFNLASIGVHFPWVNTLFGSSSLDLILFLCNCILFRSWGAQQYNPFSTPP